MIVSEREDDGQVVVPRYKEGGQLWQGEQEDCAEVGQVADIELDTSDQVHASRAEAHFNSPHLIDGL